MLDAAAEDGARHGPAFAAAAFLRVVGDAPLFVVALEFEFSVAEDGDGAVAFCGGAGAVVCGFFVVKVEFGFP